VGCAGLAALAIAASVHAGELRINGRYGASNLVPNPSYESSDSRGAVDGMQFAALEIYGPRILWGLQALVAFDHHWSGSKFEFPLTTTSNSYSIGAARSLTVGYADAVIYAGAAYSDDVYHVDQEGLFRDDLDADSWGIIAGLDLRFNFFKNVDALVGYRLITREQATFTNDDPGTYEFEVIGRDADHCISAGISVIAWGA
jgi:hypothetical protein